MSASERLVATKEEVALLRSRFEAELARQATKAAKLAAASKLMAALPAKGPRAKRADRAQQRARTNGSEGLPEDETAEFLDQSLLGPKVRGKKKKRSAMANASNPHHLKNYVPSRLPHSGQTNHNNQTNGHSQNDIGAPPIRFLSAEIPSRQWKKQSATPLPQVTSPMDEWICAFCEYGLFYGEDAQYRRAVRMRKKILRRRRRAQERAAAAASGTSTAKVPEKGVPKQEYDDEVGFEPSGSDASAPLKHSKRKGEVNGREAGKTGERGSFG